jgi:hypothetical protein
LLYGIPLAVLFPYTRWRPDGVLKASVHTEAVEFTVGDYRRAGPFTGDECADVTFESFSKAELPGVAKWKPSGGEPGGGDTEALWGGTVAFRNVTFHSLLLTKGTRVRANWYEQIPGAVRMSVAYNAIPSSVAAATVFVNDKSTVDFTSSFTESGSPVNGTIQSPIGVEGLAYLYPRADRRFPVSVAPCSPKPAESVAPPAKPSGGTQGRREPVAAAVARAPETPAALPPVDGIPLMPDTRITFLTDEGASAIRGFDNTVEVTNAERKHTLLQGQKLEIAGVRNRSSGDPSQLALTIKDGIVARLLGRAGVLQIDGEDGRPSLAEYLRAEKVLSAWLATAILIGSALLTVASRIKLVKLDEDK